jgi:hypothetical protein
MRKGRFEKARILHYQPQILEVRFQEHVQK